MNKNTIILFDLDGTLIDSTEAILESFKVAFERFGRTVPKDSAIKDLIGLPLDMMFARLGISASQIDKYVKAYREHYRTIHTDKTTLLPGAFEAVKNGYKFAYLGVVTTKTAQYSKELLEYFGIMEYFGVLIGKEDVAHPKPDPEPIIKALEALPDVTGSKFMIGDTCLDMDAASAANVFGIGVTCGYSAASKLSKCTRRIVKNASEAVNEILKEIKI